MDTKGIMRQIQEHLMEGKSSQDVIALGYAPGSVYKVQRQLRLNSGNKQPVSAQPGPELQVSVVDTEALARIDGLETENAELRAQMAELRQEFERANSLQHQLAQLQQRFECLDIKVGQSQQEVFGQAPGLVHRIEGVARQVQKLDEVVCLLGLLVYHLDVHHRQQTHRWPPDSADRDLQLSDQGYRVLQQRLRQWLTDATTNSNQGRQLKPLLPFQISVQDTHPQGFLPGQRILPAIKDLSSQPL